MSDPKLPSRPTPTVATQAGPSVTRSGSDTLGEPAGGPSALPELVGKYRLLGELGRGGMGVVFRAEDTALKREVALKVMLPQAAANASAKARFLREARAQAKVEHEHVAVIHNVEEHDGLPYLVMPLLKGMTLHEALRANPRPPLAEVIRISREVAEGLAAAHEQGLVHRDIKPANVWLEGKRLRVKVLDFGLARAVSEEAAADDGPVTREGAVVGTPAYMSPEQGRGLHVDERTDLFSLGVVLYQMTTGELPFRGATAIAILTSLAVDTPPTPIAKNPAVPPSLSDLVMRLLAKEPKGRPASAEAVADELRAIEESLTNSVRVIALGSAPPPIILGAIGPDPFADLDATETPTATDSEPSPSTTRRAGSVSDRSAFPVWAMVLGVILAVAGVIWFAAQKLRTKPPEVVKQPEDPPKEKERPPVTSKPKDKAVTDPDHGVAAWVLSMGGEVSVLVGADKVVVKTADKLPAQFQLTDVVRKNTAVKDDDLNRLRELSAVIQVNLSGTAVTDAGLRHLAEVKSLRSLWLGGCPGITDAAVPHLRQLPALGNLDLVGTRVGDTGLRELCEMRQLQFLYLSSTKVTDDGVEHLAKLPRLSALHLNSLPVTDKGLARLVGCKALNNLELIDTLVSSDGREHLAGMTSLRRLNVSMTKWTEAEVKQLRAALPNCKVEWDPADRVIAGWLLARGEFQFMLKLPDGKSVLAGQPQDLPAGAFTVVTISCGQVKFGDEDMKRLEPLTGLTAFSLWNRDPGLADAGVRSLLKWKATLTELRLSNQPFTKDGLKAIGELTELKSLALDSGTGVADDGLAHLVGLSKLEHLGLGYSPVGDNELKHLVGLKLKQLSLAGTSVTDKGLETLAEMKTLRELNLRQTKITEPGYKKLQAALPECKIDWDETK